MLLIAFGTRPEYIKIKPLLPLLKKEEIPYKLIHIGQHQDLIQITEPHDVLQIFDISSNRLDNIHLNVVDQASNWFNGVKAVLVQGDTTSAYSMALAAFNRGIKIIHLEAGLRTYDRFNPYPEEFNRRSISLMADIHLCPTNQNAQNLVKEGIRAPKYVVGNTVLDSIDTTTLPETNTVLITLHRRENIPILEQWFETINNLSKTTPNLKYVYPIHPNSDIKEKSKILNSNIKITEPLSREDLIKSIKTSKMIISDSGGIQEEACYLHKRLIICRKCTERPESIWLNSTLCKTPEYLGTAFNKMINKKLTEYQCPYGDGRASQKIIEILKKELV
jgi:UDP-N-acetylglucosamine 2-epimerase (non-hydrolysing)